MVSIRHSNRLTMRCVALVLVCLLCHMLLTDCGPIRKKKSKSKSVSVTASHGMRDSTLNQSPNVNQSSNVDQSSNVNAGVNADNLQEVRANKNVVHFGQIDSAGKQVASDNVDDAGNGGAAAGNGPVPGVLTPHRSVGDGGKIGDGRKTEDGGKVEDGEKVWDGGKAGDGEQIGDGRKTVDGGKAGDGEKVWDGGKAGDGEQIGDGRKTVDGGKAGDGEKVWDGGKAGDGEQIGDGRKTVDGGKAGDGEKVWDGGKAGDGEQIGDGRKTVDGGKAGDGEKVWDGGKAGDGEQIGDGRKTVDGGKAGDGEKVWDGGKAGDGEQIGDGRKTVDGGKAGDGEQIGDGRKTEDGEKVWDGGKAGDSANTGVLIGDGGKVWDGGNVGDGGKGLDGGKVGQLPAVLAIPKSSKLNTKSVGNGDEEKRREEQGLAVGVGGMNREISTTPAPVVYHDGPDDSLYVGAADREHSPEGRQKAQSQNEAPVNDLSDADQIRGDGFPGNPALQQPPPQAREPPDQFRDKKIQLGPVKPDRDAPVLQAPGQQSAPLGSDEIKLKAATLEPPSAAEASNDEQRIKDHVLKFSKQKSEEKQSEKLDDINPPDHMEGFRLERDGHLNRDYKKEIFLGHHEEFEWTDEEKVSGKLKVIFRRVDTDKDDNIDAKEIEMWIMKNVKVHLDDAIKDNAKVFKHLDADKDGYVSWFEFFSHFLVAKGYVHSAKNVPKNESAIKLETDDSEHILKYKYRWADADEEPKDLKLNIDEMMNFRHPEQSKMSIERLIADLIDSVDKDADGIITEEEFIALPHDLAGENPLPLEKEWQEERKKEFRNVIDLNKDGKADNTELKIYFDPHNVNHARLEADNLIKMADSNGDGKLSVDEVLDNTELFLGSKMVDARRKLHDEF